MKTFMKFMSFLIISLAFVACSNDSDDSNNPSAREVRLEGSVYKDGENWCLNTNLRDANGFHFGDEDTWKIKINDFPKGVSPSSIEGVNKTFTGYIISQGSESDGKLIVIYYYDFNISAIE